ncbi:hypothetical protein CC85DRAFT_284606 [Cutaneotrichosporon oleaginosum]|uniref:Protein CPL1-like domain-containing protein n=1 Tax=Cutaneotrichosporon oleaginosum TaxID=879819 RepID=A0A0J0XQ87_9TREE|nr:uncharacterized protein CC85DRAFT_284606 [Cutaneotrichosporon oleaginosum]KLT43263.1 hypothetical protein CC85DRAFT_284606 [Cutaneotrichosporon oleaginosum]TXT14473.1 hypothetical protein COLE_00666 [Cutaneotrichosporon oleaginosum]
MLFRTLLLSTLFAGVLAAPAIHIPGLSKLETPSKLQPRAPQASRRMGQRRRRAHAPPAKKDYSTFLCPAAAVACPVADLDTITPESAAALEGELASLADWFRVGFECIEPETELNQCGGCLALGKGQDCATIANARATACDAGACKVLSCKDGYVVSPEGKLCVRPDDPRLLVQ